MLLSISSIRDCILIDDLPANIMAWEKMGGTGIINTGAEDTRMILEEMGLLEPVEADH